MQNSTGKVAADLCTMLTDFSHKLGYGRLGNYIHRRHLLYYSARKLLDY